MHKEDEIKFFEDTLNSCLLPPLTTELGTACLESKHFEKFRDTLNVQLLYIFDFIQQHETYLLSTEKETLNIRVNFILLLCEQSSPNTLFQTNNPNFIKNISVLLDKHFHYIIANDVQVVENIFKYYKNNLKSTNWKKSFGAALGFVEFLKLYSNDSHHSLNNDLSAFILSVGLLYNDFYDPVYKQLSLKVFKTLLNHVHQNQIKELNIHNVIYDAIVGNVSKIDSETGIRDLWSCLCKCLDLTDIGNFSKWSKTDDLIEVLVQRIAFTSNPKICVTLFLTLSTICIHQSQNKNQIMPFLKDEIFYEFENQASSLRDNCKGITSLTSYRWAKKILSLLIAESHHLLGSCYNSYQMLCAMHICYLIFIFPIPLKVIDLQLLNFFDKYPAVLMDVLRTHKEVEGVRKGIKAWLETFLYQTEGYEGSNENILNYKIALMKILQNEIFINN